MRPDNGEGSAPESEEATQAFFADPNWVHVVTLIERPGAMEFFHDVEWTHYPPNTAKNDAFQMRLWNWQGLVWVIASVPIADKHFMVDAAARHGLRLAADYSIVMAGPAGLSRFPVHGERVFPLQPARKASEKAA